MNKVFCFTGGVSRGNPGPAAIGVSVTDASGVMIGEMARMIGNSTSSFADYQAVMAGLQLLVELLGTDSRATDIIISLENDEVKKQLNAEVPITEPGFVPLFIEPRGFIQTSKLPPGTFMFCSRRPGKTAGS